MNDEASAAGRDGELRALGLELLEGLERRCGVELSPLLHAPSLDTGAKIALMRERLVHAAFADPDAMMAGAGAGAGPGDARAAALAAARRVEVEPFVFIPRADALKVVSYQGTQITDYVKQMAKRLDNIHQSKTIGTFVATTLGGGLIGVGLTLTFGTLRNVYAGMVLRQALLKAVTSFGLGGALLAVGMALVGFMVWLVLEKPEKLLGLIINDTDEDYVVHQWRQGAHGGGAVPGCGMYMAHGDTWAFMADGHLVNDPAELQLAQRLLVYKDDGRIDDEQSAVCLGVYFADRKAGFLGVEGLYVFAARQTGAPPRDAPPRSFAYQFAIPYTQANGCLMMPYLGRYPYGPHELESLFRSMYTQRSVRQHRTAFGWQYVAALDAAYGGVISGIAMVSAPVPPRPGL